MAKNPDHGTQTLPRTETRKKIQEPPRYRVVMHNDDYTTMEFVLRILRTIFRKSEEESVVLMLQVHQQGSALAGVYTRDVAETKVAQVTAEAEMEGFPFLCTVEPDGGG